MCSSSSTTMGRRPGRGQIMPPSTGSLRTKSTVAPTLMVRAASEAPHELSSPESTFPAGVTANGRVNVVISVGISSMVALIRASGGRPRVLEGSCLIRCAMFYRVRLTSRTPPSARTVLRNPSECKWMFLAPVPNSSPSLRISPSMSSCRADVAVLSPGSAELDIRMPGRPPMRCSDSQSTLRCELAPSE